jgi:acetyl-CoA synthetase
VGAGGAGWIDFAARRPAQPGHPPDVPDAGRRPAAAVLHLRHHQQAQAGAAHHQSYPVGHLSTMYWLGLQPGDVHWNISSPGWAKHAWSCFFAPWNAQACIFIYNYARFNAAALLDVLVEQRVRRCARRPPCGAC